MNFDSPFFLFCFLPLLLILHFVIRGERARNILLLAAGLIFYSFGSISGLALLAASAAVNYALGRFIEPGGGKKARLIFGIILNLAFLGAYKYLDFLLSGVSAVFGSSVKSMGLIAPVGISFFTFRSISYLMDVYRQKAEAERNFFKLLLYISFFPQLMAGPIARYGDFAARLRGRSCTAEDTARGLRRLAIGLGKKLVISAVLGNVADAVFAFGSAADARLAWLGAVAYMLQIYFDFSGYSDMAIGLGGAFGFASPENFDYPYISCSITEFWRRWHISLSLWFRDYLYIPLGGNRRGNRRAALNKFIVFTLCGLWHGAAWTFIIWGAWHGALAAAESIGSISKRIEKSAVRRVVGRVYALFAVCLGFVMFRAAGVKEGFGMIGAMFGAAGQSAESTVLLHTVLNAESVFMIFLAIAAATPVFRRLYLALSARGGRFGGAVEHISYALTLLLFVLCLIRLAAGGFSPFIYFQF